MEGGKEEKKKTSFALTPTHWSASDPLLRERGREGGELRRSSCSHFFVLGGGEGEEEEEEEEEEEALKEQ